MPDNPRARREWGLASAGFGPRESGGLQAAGSPSAVSAAVAGRRPTLHGTTAPRLIVRWRCDCSTPVRARVRATASSVDATAFGRASGRSAVRGTADRVLGGESERDEERDGAWPSTTKWPRRTLGPRRRRRTWRRLDGVSVEPGSRHDLRHVAPTRTDRAKERPRWFARTSDHCSSAPSTGEA